MTTIWHNPRCSKSRQTLALLRERGIEPEQRLYLRDGPDETELRDVLARLGKSAIDIMRTKDSAFREMGLGPGTPEDELIAAMAERPALIERPIVLAGGRAAIGRPPEAVLEILPGTV